MIINGFFIFGCVLMLPFLILAVLGNLAKTDRRYKQKKSERENQ